MPTTAESRALAFFAGLFALGGVLRAVDQLRPPPTRGPDADSALTEQLARVDTARSAGHERSRPKGRRGPKTSTADSMPAAPPAGVPPELAAVVGWFTRDRPKPVATPATRGSAGSRAAGRSVAPGGGRVAADTPPTEVDLDTADEAAIEALPGIGPSLARRLVADREANGPFGSFEGLARVKGVGPVLVARLTGRVTFSGVARPR